MNSSNYEKTEFLINRWWLSLIVGLVAIALGFVILANPATSYYTFSTWLGVVILLSGAMGLIQSTSSRNYFVHRTWLILASAADMIIGILLMFNFLLSEMIMPILLGAWLLYRGCTTLAQGFDLRSYGIRDAGWVIFYAAIIIAISVAILWLPVTLGTEAVILFVAIAFIAYGVSSVSLAFRLWEVHRHARALGSDE